MVAVAFVRPRTDDDYRGPAQRMTIDSGRIYPERWSVKTLELLVFDPLQDWSASRVDMRGLSADGEFICAAVSSSDRAIICATTSRSGLVRLASIRLGRNGWTSQTIWESNREMFNFVRSLSVADLDDDGDAEIVIGTKPNGVVLLLDPAVGGYRETILDQNSHGAGCTNTREVLIADVDNDGSFEVLATNAYASESGKWSASPGSITMYKRSGRTWQRRVIEDFAGKTHSRMFVVGDVLNTGENQLVANVVGVFDPASHSINPPSLLTLYENVGGAVRSHTVDTLRQAVKARGMAVADISGDGRRSLIVGTRSLDLNGYRRSYLLCYRLEAGSWSSEEIDRSGEMGFHTVAAMDIDNDGCEEVIASDDERGLIKCYKRGPSGWRATTVHDAGSAIFVASICALSSRP
jgi:hypothetical protein